MFKKQKNCITKDNRVYNWRIVANNEKNKINKYN